MKEEEKWKCLGNSLRSYDSIAKQALHGVEDRHFAN